MSQPEKTPDVVDLQRYKQAVQARKARATAAKAPSRPEAAGGGPGQSFLGSRPRAGLILALLAAAGLAWTLIPRLM